MVNQEAVETSDKPMSMSDHVLFGFLFGGVAVAFLFVTFRLSVRWKIFRQLFWDDALVVLSWTLLVGIAAASWVNRDGMYIMWYMLKGIKPWTTENIRLVINQLRMLVAISVMFLTALWSIKLSFLIFFRRLGVVKRSQRIWWWVVTSFTVLSFLAIVAATPYWCTSSDLNVLITKCNTPWSRRYRRIFYFCYLAGDLTSDALVMSIPVIMLWKVKMPLKQKMGLMALFCLTIIVIICSIVSTTYNGSGHGADQDATWMIFWLSLEVTISIIIACCGAFRQLFKKLDERNTRAGASSTSRSKPKGFVPLGSKGRAKLEDQDAEQGLIKGPKHIIVSHEVEVRQMAVPMTQISPAHHGHHPSISSTGRGVPVYESSLPLAQEASVRPGLL